MIRNAFRLFGSYQGRRFSFSLFSSFALVQKLWDYEETCHYVHSKNIKVLKLANNSAVFCFSLILPYSKFWSSCSNLEAKWFSNQKIQSNLAIRNGLIRNKLVLRNHFLWPICHLLHKDKELLALRNNFRATKKFLIAKFDCIFNSSTINNMILSKVKWPWNKILPF